MDRFQTRVIEAIDKRESPSLKNDITIHNSYHTGNDFTSNIFCGNDDNKKEELNKHVSKQEGKLKIKDNEKLNMQLSEY